MEKRYLPFFPLAGMMCLLNVKLCLGVEQISVQGNAASVECILSTESLSESGKAKKICVKGIRKLIRKRRK